MKLIKQFLKAGVMENGVVVETDQGSPDFCYFANIRRSYQMKLETITHGLVILLEQNHYHENTIKFYKREWEKIEKTAESWKKQAEELRCRIEAIAHKAGRKLMAAFGYELPDNSGISEYPDRDVSQALSDMQQQAKQYDSSELRVIPDPDHAGMYRVAIREKDSSYQTLQGRFSDRHEAESWRRNYSGYANSMNPSEDKERNKNSLLRYLCGRATKKAELLAFSC